MKSEEQKRVAPNLCTQFSPLFMNHQVPFQQTKLVDLSKFPNLDTYNIYIDIFQTFFCSEIMLFQCMLFKYLLKLNNYTSSIRKTWTVLKQDEKYICNFTTLACASCRWVRITSTHWITIHCLPIDISYVNENVWEVICDEVWEKFCCNLIKRQHAIGLREIQNG